MGRKSRVQRQPCIDWVLGRKEPPDHDFLYCLKIRQCHGLRGRKVSGEGDLNREEMYKIVIAEIRKANLKKLKKHPKITGSTKEHI